MQAKRHPYTFTNHAWKRVMEMGLSRQQELDVLADAETDYASFDDRRVAAKGSLAVCYKPAGRFIVTVMWRTSDTYLRAEQGHLWWREAPERVLAALLAEGADPATAAAALTRFGVDAVAVVVVPDRPLVHVAPLELLVDVETKETFPLPAGFFLEQPFELAGRTHSYVPTWTSPDTHDLARLVPAMERALEQAFDSRRPPCSTTITKE